MAAKSLESKKKTLQNISQNAKQASNHSQRSLVKRASSHCRLSSNLVTDNLSRAKFYCVEEIRIVRGALLKWIHQDRFCTFTTNQECPLPSGSPRHHQESDTCDSRKLTTWVSVSPSRFLAPPRHVANTAEATSDYKSTSEVPLANGP